MCDNEGLFEGALVRTKEAGQTGEKSLGGSYFTTLFLLMPCHAYL